MQLLVTLLVSLAAALLKAFLESRKATMTIEENIHLRVQINTLEGVRNALQFKADARHDPVGAGDLRVRPGARRVPLPGEDAGPDGTAG